MSRTGSEALLLMVLMSLIGGAAALAAPWRQGSSAPVRGAAAALIECTKIEAEIVVAAPLVDAWRCWSTAEGAQSFFARKAIVEPHPGGRFEMWFNPDAAPGERGAEDLEVLSVLPGEMISFEWSAPPQFAHARPQRTWVVVTFAKVDDAHTRVRLVHLGWDEMKARNAGHEREWDAVKSYFEQAWPYVLGSLKRRFDEGPRFDAQGNVLWKD